MALEAPQLAYARQEDERTLDLALRLAREVEELLEETSSMAAGSDTMSSAHSTRIVRAMAASLVDELEAVVRGARKAHVA
jgi:hypothetical protein